MTGDHHHPHHERAPASALGLALGANAVFLVVEVVGGFLFDSLALLADAAHMATDVAGLAIALIAQRLVGRPATARHSYGLQRAEVLAAQANGLLLLVASLWIGIEAVARLDQPATVEGVGLLVVATVGLVVNLGSAAVLARSGSRTLNLRGAMLHMASDALSSAGAMVAGIAVVIWDADRADPIVSLLIAVLVVVAAFRLLRDTTHVLLEGAPPDVRADEVEELLMADPAVAAVHHLHVWSIASDTPALSAHVVMRDEITLHDAQAHGDRLRAALLDRFAIAHSTLELECHDCESPHQ